MEGVHTANFVFQNVSSLLCGAGLHTAVIVLKQAFNGKTTRLRQTHTPHHAERKNLCLENKILLRVLLGCLQG